MDDFSSESSEASFKWIHWFLTCKGNEFFCKVEEEFILDRFNLTGLNTETTYYTQALQTILDQSPQDVSEDTQIMIDKSARHLYGLIHARYILSSAGISRMVSKFKAGDFGRCPRVLCYGQCLLPIGLSDVPFEKSVKLYCPQCEDIYAPKSQRHAAIDGAYFGSTFPHMLMLHYPFAMPEKISERYEPRIFGFKVNEYANIHRQQDAMRQRQNERLQQISEIEQNEHKQSMRAIQ